MQSCISMNDKILNTKLSEPEYIALSESHRTRNSMIVYEDIIY